MTHGDKKAKTGKTGQASVKKASSKEEARGKGGKAAGPAAKAGKEAGKGKARPERKEAAERVEAGGKAGVQKAGDPRLKARGAANGNGGPFSDAAVAAAFKHALKKYANAFRRLTD